MTSITTQEHKVRRGEAYVVSVDKNIGAGSTLNVHVENPSNSGVRAVITSIKISSPDGKMKVNLPYGFTVDSTGTAESINNRARGSSKSTSLNSYKDTTFSSADHTDSSWVGTGSVGAGTAIGGIDEDVLGSILEDGDLIIEAENPSGSNARDCSITVTYYETSARNPT